MLNLTPIGQRNFDVSIACPLLSGLALALRIYCKLYFKNGVHIDDYWMTLSVLFAWAAGVVEIWGNVTGGRGREMKAILVEAVTKKNMKIVENYLLGLYLAWMLYLVAVFAIKFSVLLFYRQIFIQPFYRRASMFLLGTSTVLFIVSEIVWLNICAPLDGFWHRLKPAKCMNSNNYLLGAGLSDALLDTLIVLLPIRMVFTLHLPRRTQIALCGIFALGGLVVVTNFLRAKFMYQPKEIQANYNEALLWSSIHIMTGHICACLPIYKPLWQSISAVILRFTTRVTSNITNTLQSRLGKSSKPRRRPLSHVFTQPSVMVTTQDRSDQPILNSANLSTIRSISSGPTLVPPTYEGLLNVKIESGCFDLDEHGWQIPDESILFTRDVYIV